MADIAKGFTSQSVAWPIVEHEGRILGADDSAIQVSVREDTDSNPSNPPL
jgi:hypothetical protein